VKIAALRLFNVKRFAGRGVAIEGIGDGVNVLCAVNEFGKSTSFEALHALFFQPHSSTAGDVRGLRPYAGGNPLVQADIATEAGRYRITKQFYGGRSARVVDLASDRIVAQADEAEAFIAGLIRGGTGGPAGLLWVRQGVTGIERRSRTEEESEKQVRATLLESVQGEVEAVTGGRRMAEILAATEEALERLVTPTGRPKAGERYAAAIEQRDRLEAQERRLASEVDTLRHALDKRSAAMKRLAELDRADDREERQKAIETAQAAFDAAKTRAESLRAAEAELNLGRGQRDAVAKELGMFRTAVEKEKDLQVRLADARRQRVEALARREAATTAITRARSDMEGAETQEQEARALLARLDAALKARDAAERLAELDARLAAAEAARQAIEEGEATLARLALPEKAVAELEGLDVEIAKLRAVAEAARPSVGIAYEPNAPTVIMDGRPLAEGEARFYDGQAELVVPGIGMVTLRSSRSAVGDKRLEAAEARRRELLASMGVEDLAAARRRQVEAQRKDGDLRELRARLSLLAPDGLPKLREEIGARRAEAGEGLELKEDPAQVRGALADAEERRRGARQALREAEPMDAGAAGAIIAAETALATLAAERVQLEAVLGAEEARAERERELVGRLAGFEAGLAEGEAAVAKLRQDATDLVSAEATLRRVRSVADAAEKEIGLLRETQAGLGAEIRARSEDAVEEKWRETADALSAASTRVAAFEKEVAVLQRLRRALETARSEARDTYLKPVMTELQPLLGLLFDDFSITFDEKTLLPHKILRNGQEEEVERLSGGMREQLSVLTRLAFARLLARDGRPAPVILDDALVYSDDDRIEKMFDALHRQARDQQIIVFSCRQRAFQKLGGNVLRMTDWQPDP
jgi:DNA repair exonuclease SbcCD ATPase subunit